VKRITITVDDELMAELDRMIERDGYTTRSEAMRDLARLGLRSAALEAGEVRQCVGVLSYVYDHEARDLARRLTTSHHDHQEISVASLHVHLDAGQCLEVSVLKGRTDTVRALRDDRFGERAVAYGDLKIVPQQPEKPGRKHHGHE